MTDDHHHHDHDRGLEFDVRTLMSRRHALPLLAGVGATALVGCATQDESSTAASSSPAESSATTGPTGTSSPTDSATSDTVEQCVEIPEETAGPFPGDGSNGPNVLTESGIVRSDITSSFGSASGVAEGVPLTINLTILDLANGCAPLSYAAVYLWHCTRDGEYSLYSDTVGDENYLRGVQETNADGVATFTSIFPGAYSGRWPHIHFEVYASLNEATAAGQISATSQIALPQDVCELVYATEGYSQSISNLSQTSLERDNVFGDDGGVSQLATVTGNVADGFIASLSVVV